MERRKSDSNAQHNVYDKRVQIGSKNSKFGRMMNSGGLPLKEIVPESSSSQSAFDDNIRLVNEPKPSGIMITNQIVQSHEPRDPLSPADELSHIIPASWASHSPKDLEGK
jgi:hypothetical protein